MFEFKWVKNMSVKFGIQLPHDPHDLIVRAAVFADKNGFDSVFTPDHLVGVGIKNWSSYEAFTLLGYLASVTKKVKLGTCVSDVLRRHPAVLAQFAVTLHDFSNGRAILGLGAGEGMNLLPYGIETKNMVSKLEEGFDVIEKLMEEDEVTYDGKYFSLRKAFIMPRKRVPIWIAGNSPRTLELTARADGWIPFVGIGPKRYKESLAILRKAGREIEAGLFAYVVVEKSYEEALRKIELPAKLISLMSPARKQFLSKTVLEALDLPDLFGFTFNRETISKAVEMAKKLPFEAVEHRFIYGTPDDVIARIEKFVKAGAEHFVLTPLVRHIDYIPTVKLIAEEVMPYFKESSRT